MIQNYDERRNIVILSDKEKAVDFAVEHFIKAANQAIKNHGFFAVALSGGTTPKAIFKKLCENENVKKVDYSKVLLFWSDERAVSKEDESSNYKMAMDAGFRSLVPEDHIFPMDGLGNLELNANAYEATIKFALPSGQFDLVMLGMGDDGHTASLFPNTEALHIKNKLVAANQVPQKNTSRLTFTFLCINLAKEIVIYVLGEEKAAIVKEVFHSPFDLNQLPVQAIGTKEHKALWILDDKSASQLF